MINSLRKIERIFVCEQNSLLDAPGTFPNTAEFPIPLISGSIVDLCSISIPVKRQRDDISFFVSAVINWEMTSPASVAANPPGTAQVAFELVRNDTVISRAMDTLVRPPGVAGSVTAFGTVNLAHLDVPNNCGYCSQLARCITFKVRANNIFLDDSGATAAAGAVILKIEELR